MADPPFRRRTFVQALAVVLSAHVIAAPLPQLQKKLNPTTLNVNYNNPPFGLLETNVDPWIPQPVTPAQLTARKLTPPDGHPQGQVDAPYPTARPDLDTRALIVGSWQPPPPLPTLRVKLTGSLLDGHPAGQVDSPYPSLRPDLNTRDLIVRAWQPPAPLPALQKRGIFPGIPPVVTADNPPFGLLETNIDPWLGPAPLPTRPRQSNPTVLDNPPVAPTADNPPGYPASDITVVDIFVPLPQQSKKLNPAFLNVPPPPIDNPIPQRGGAQIQVAFSWIPGPPLPTLRGKVNGATLNNPPPVASVDNPPFGLLETNIDPWLGPPPLPTRPRQLPADQLNNPSVAADNPPGYPASDLAVVSIPDPLPTLPRKLNPAFLDNPAVVTVDNPPPYRRALHNILAQWQPPFPQIITLYVTTQDGIANVVPPPTVRRGIGKIYTTRMSLKDFENRHERFSDKYYAELLGTERAIEDAEEKAETLRPERREALEEAAEKTAEVLNAAAGFEAHRAELHKLARDLAAATAARKASEQIAKAKAVAIFAESLAKAYQAAFDEDEEETITMLLLH
jgi:hypothetical protein